MAQNTRVFVGFVCFCEQNSHHCTPFVAPSPSRVHRSSSNSVNRSQVVKAREEKQKEKISPRVLAHGSCSSLVPRSRFLQKNFAPGCARNGDLAFGRPLASPFF